jgi:tetratricopeptide (TPR) repeat protein
VFDGGFTLEAAEAVLELDALWPVDGVQALVNKSLVRRVGPSRFGLLVSVQEYAAEKLDASGRRAAAEARHGQYFAQFGLEPALDALDSHGGLARRSALTLEIDNLAAASLRAVARRDVETALHTALAAWAVLVTRGPYHFGVTVLEIAREIMPPRSAARAALLNALGDAVQLAGDSPAATACLEEARDLCRSFGDRRGEAHAINLLSVVSWQRGRPDEAIVLGEEALALCREIDAPLIESRVLGNLGAAAFLQGRLEEARARNEAAIAIDRALGNRRAEGSSFGNLGIVLSLQGRFDEARAQFEAALVLHRALGSRREESIALANLGQLLRQQGDLEGAPTNCLEAVVVNRQIGNRRIEGVALGELGAVHVAAGRRVEALECLSQAEAVLRSVHDRHQLCLVLASRAICEAPVDPARAMRDLAEAEACATQLGDLPDSEVRQRIAEAREALGGD